MRGRRAVVPLFTLMLATLLELSSVAARSLSLGEGQDAQAPAATELTGLEVGRNADGVTVTIKGNGRLSYGTLQEADRPPLRLVVDFPGVRAGVPAATPGQGPLRRVRVALNNASPLVTRVVLDLDVKTAFNVRPSPDGREMTITLAVPNGASEPTAAVEAPARAPAPAPARAATTPAPAPAPAAPAVVPPATRLSAVTAAKAAEGVAITLRGNGRLTWANPEESADAPPRLVIDVPGVRAAAAATTVVNQSVVDRVRVTQASQNPLVTRVVVQMKRQYLYRVQADEANPRQVVVTIADPSASTPAAASFTLAKALAAPPARTASVTPAPAQPAAGQATSTPAASTARATATRQPRMEPTVAARKPGDTSPKQFTGHPISLDFQGVDLRAVLRTFAEITGLNLVIDPDVKGTVDVSLHEVPWDQALDIILRANQLDYTVEGTIVRIAPVDVLRAEAESRRKLLDEQALSGELVTITKTLNHAKAKDLAPLLTKTALTKRSQIDVDERTNTLIITDLQLGLDRATKLIIELDAPQLQVEIEARIVRTTKTFARDLGIRWGFFGNATPELGNTLPFTFPNTVTGSGSVPLPGAGGATGVIDSTVPTLAGVALKALNGALTLDAALSALERDNKVQILLRPRVVTQNNIKATITRGEEIPYTTLTAPSSSGSVNIIQPIPQVQFKTAALNLNVTPRISNNGAVILEVDVDNGSRGTEEANGNVSINTQRVVTTVLVKDQGTTVIGGIYETFSDRVDDRTPGLHKLPFIGRLFKSSQLTENEGELLIFITPRILKDGQVAQVSTSAVQGAGK
jgi:type IV pilus assembly protein PilQ